MMEPRKHIVALTRCEIEGHERSIRILEAEIALRPRSSKVSAIRRAIDKHWATLIAEKRVVVNQCVPID
jgi:hypothetical protein